MTKSWSNGRVDRGVNRRSRSRDRSRDRAVEPSQRHQGGGRTRNLSHSPARSNREEVRKHNKGRELLDSRNFGRGSPSSSATKRRRSGSPSANQSHSKKSRRRDPSPSRRRSPDRDSSPSRAQRRTTNYDPLERRHPSPSRRDRRGRTPPRYRPDSPQRGRSPNRSPNRYPPSRRLSPGRDLSKERRRDFSIERGRKSSPGDRYAPSAHSRQSPAPKVSRDSTPPPKKKERNRHRRDEYRPGQGGSTKSSRGTASGANSVEINMNHRGGGYGGHPGYIPQQNQQMQAAFPLNPQYNQPPNYSQSPHVTPNSSYQGSPQAQSPYATGMGGFQPPHQHFSPQQQYAPNYPQGTYGPPPPVPAAGPPTGPQAHLQGNSPQYHQRQPHGYSGPNYRGNHQGYQGNQFGPNRGPMRGRGGGPYQNPNQNWPSGPPPTGPGRIHHNNSGGSTPQHNAIQAFNNRNSEASSRHASPQAPPPEDDENDNPFRPSKELQVEDTNSKPASSDRDMPPPPARPPPTGPQAQSKFSFAFKGSSKPQAAPKLEISQKLTAAPSAPPPRREPPSTSYDRDRGIHPSRAAHFNSSPAKSPASTRQRPEPREPREPATRKVKKIMKREKPRPALPEEFASSDSVYFRKPGNESVVGSGTYGKVFKGVHVYTKNMVALKKIRMEGERDGFPVTAVREIKLLQSLKHDNIVKLHEVMVERNDCFMVFEYLSHDLTGILNHPTFKLHDSHKKDLAKQMFEGLDYLHRKGVLHRDIKAANILVSSEGQLKIADFGLARFYAKRRQLEYTNRVITIWYRSPELLLGETQYGPEVDIWSAACVLVEIFTRHAIFPGDGTEMNQLDKIYAILGTPTKAEWPGLIDMAWFELLRPASKKSNILAERYKERVSPAAYELMEAMFQYDPAKRPSASDVLEHPYFTTEEPAPKKVTELRDLQGDWHEFESKALRKENERKDKEAKKALQKEATAKDALKKRSLEGDNVESDAKRQQIAAPSQAVGAPLQPSIQ